MFKLKSNYSLSNDQKKATKEIIKNIKSGFDFQTLWGVTGSGKTFTMANVVEKIQKPTLVIAHNKTLAAQLAQEFKEFFPKNAVHYFVSYYDYYQPEAYISKTDTYIEKEATINEEINRLRHAATQDLLTRKDVIIVASVSCIYGIGDINSYMELVLKIKIGEKYQIEDLLKQLVIIQFKRTSSDFKPGDFLVKGDILEIYPLGKEHIITIEFWGNEVNKISTKHHLTRENYENLEEIMIFPAKHTVTTKEKILSIIPEIKKELKKRLKYFKEDLKDVLKYERLKTKVEYDIEMMEEVGYVNGIENYSRYLNGRKEGDSPETLIDYFPSDLLCFVDESHMTFSQIGGMYAGDRSRKENLIGNGFRLPSAFDNRPLRFEEFEKKVKKIIAVSATPAKYEIARSYTIEAGPKKELVLEKQINKFFDFDSTKDGEWKSSSTCRIIEQIIRPTGLLDPEIFIKSIDFVVDDIMKNIHKIKQNNERMLITTITKRSSEELSDYLMENGIKVRYLHSEIETLERLEILKELREGVIDVIVGVNLLREGLDLPEVSKIAIIDADKQGFLRSASALIQTIGRASRNENGKVYMYCECFKGSLDSLKFEEDNIYLGKLYRFDKGKLVNLDGVMISEAMKKAISLTYYRRDIQNKYNKKHKITPTTIYSNIKDIGISTKKSRNGSGISTFKKEDIKKEISKLELEMDIAAANMQYEEAAKLRDQIIEFKEVLK